MTTKR